MMQLNKDLQRLASNKAIFQNSGQFCTSLDFRSKNSLEMGQECRKEGGMYPC